jgi:carbamoyl-phosphate synthase small subunit
MRSRTIGPTRTLNRWLQDEGIPGISGLDTRRLTKKLRTHGVMLGILKVCEPGEEPNIDALLNEAKTIPDPNLTNLVNEVAVEEPVTYNVAGKNTAVLIDTGVKNSIIRNFLKRGMNVVSSYDFSAKEIMISCQTASSSVTVWRPKNAFRPFKH